MASFSKIVQQKRVLDDMQFNYFHTLTFGMTVQVFAENGFRVKGHFFEENSTFNYLYRLKTKSRKIIPNVAR